MGRLGSARPARLRRMAPATAATPVSWPITRSCRWSSSRTSLAISLSMSRETGIPVQRLTTEATSSSVTSSLSMVITDCSSANSFSRAANSESSAGSTPYWSSAARWRSPARVARSDSTLASSILCLVVLIASIWSFSCCQWVDRRSSSSVTSAISSRTAGQTSPWRASSGSFSKALASISSCRSRPGQGVDLLGHRIDLDSKVGGRLVH